MRKDSLISFGDYLSKGKTFTIPNYQRGYVWGKNQAKKEDLDSVSYLTKSLILSFKSQQEIFLQGITVNEDRTENDTITIIDGQQRTTYLYLLIACLGRLNDFNFTINYKIRDESNKFLKQVKESQGELDKLCTYDTSEAFQDIFFFKKTMQIILKKIASIDKDKFYEFIIHNIRFLYINIEQSENAIDIFTMMNGNKAIMQTEEIIKAELLRLASLNMSDDITLEWEANMLRSRYAREWDKWLHWWNQNEVKSWIKCDGTMGLLISSYYKKKHTDVLSFEGFKRDKLKSSSKGAKDVFDGLRRLQKRFEDTYNNPITYNYIAAIVRLLSGEDKFKFIKHYFVDDPSDDPSLTLNYYYKCVFLSMSHDEIIKKDSGEFDAKYNIVHTAIQDDDLYNSNSEAAFRLLLRLNIDEDCKQNNSAGRRFDFAVWDGDNQSGNRSLEHIYPKSKVWHKDDNEKYVDGNNYSISEDKLQDSKFISRESITTVIEKRSGSTIENITISTTEHSIGNLVLLYKNENSKFNDKPFADKKKIFFEPVIEDVFRSRHLLHTIYTFANDQWLGKNIAENKYKIVKAFEKYYNEE